jgi:molybdate transport system ATP-binding protein
MIQARIRKRFRRGPEPAGFALELEFQAAAGVSVLFGSSGSGKTLTLDVIAGFVAPDEGRILLDDEILFDAAARVNLPPQQRHCGYVFQNYALFPHMTLRQNIEFAASCPSRSRKPRLERHRGVNEILERFHLKDVAGRHPHEASGGQKQRCSIARALVSEPRLLLLDEPTDGLDAALRTEFYEVLQQVRKEFRIPVLLVTHSLEECLELGEEMLVMRDGKLVQSGAPGKILDQPASLEVARLLGIYNLLEAQITALDPANRTSRIRFQDFDLQGPYFPGHLRGDRVWLCVRPEQLGVAAREGKPGVNQVPAQLLRVGEKPHAMRLEFAGGVAVELTRAEFEKQKHNRDWVIEFPSQTLRAL